MCLLLCLSVREVSESNCLAYNCHVVKLTSPLGLGCCPENSLNFGVEGTCAWYSGSCFTTCSTTNRCTSCGIVKVIGVSCIKFPSIGGASSWIAIETFDAEFATAVGITWGLASENVLVTGVEVIGPLSALSALCASLLTTCWLRSLTFTQCSWAKFSICAISWSAISSKVWTVSLDIGVGELEWCCTSFICLSSSSTTPHTFLQSAFKYSSSAINGVVTSWNSQRSSPEDLSPNHSIFFTSSRWSKKVLTSVRVVFGSTLVSTTDLSGSKLCCLHRSIVKMKKINVLVIKKNIQSS